MRPKYKKYAISAFVSILLLCFLLGVFLILLSPDQLTYLQNMIIKTGECTLSSGDIIFEIQADTATVKNDMLILKGAAVTGEEPFVVLNSELGLVQVINTRSGPILAKSVSICYVGPSKDMLEITFEDVEGMLEGNFKALSLRMESKKKWQLWLSRMNKKIKSIIRRK